MAKNYKYELFTSPAGEAVYPWLSEADTKHVPTGIYKTDLSVPMDLAKEFIEKLERIRDEFISTLPPNKQRTLTPKPVYMEELTRPTYPENATDEDKAAAWENFVQEPTGNALFRFKMKKKVILNDEESFEQEPIIVDATNGAAITDPVYGGSIIRVKGQVVPYTNDASGVVGVTLRLKSVGVLELKTGGEASSVWTEFNNDE